MSGVSLGKSNGRPHTGKKTLRRGHDGAGADHVVLIDVECEAFSNIIFIDVPDPTPKNFRAKTAAEKDKRRSPLRNIIFIDDDETNKNEYPEFDVEDDCHFFHDPSPSMRPCSTSKSAKEPLDETGDDCQFVRENSCPVKLSKCKRTYSGKAPVQNRYGLMSDSESSSSDDDELMEDYSGQLREQWQKASLKRKNDNCGQSGVRDINSASTVEIQPEPGESEEHPACSGYSKSSTEKEDLSPKPTRESRYSSGMADVHDEGDPQMENFEESYPSIPREYQQHPFMKKHSEQGNEGSIPAAGSRSEFGANHNEAQPGNRGSLVEEDLSESVSMNQHKDERHDDVNRQDRENVEPHVENCIITERERIKETFEYKKALEEEMATRQRALATQMKRNIHDLDDGEFAAAIAASAFAICSLEENAGSQYQTKTRGPVIRPAETAPMRRPSMMNRKTSTEIVTITPAANDKIQKGISRGSRNAENKADAWEKAQIAKIRKRHDELLSALLAWENEKKMKAKQQMERRKNQVELAMKRNLQHYKNKLARIDDIAKGARTQAEEKRRYEESTVKEKSNKIRSTGTEPVTCYCF